MPEINYGAELNTAKRALNDVETLATRLREEQPSDELRHEARRLEKVLDDLLEVVRAAQDADEPQNETDATDRTELLGQAHTLTSEKAGVTMALQAMGRHRPDEKP